MRRILAALALILAMLAPQAARAACTNGGCVQAGPRLASVNAVQGTLLQTLLGSLAGSSLTLNVLDWNAIAAGDVSLLKTLNVLQSTLGVANTQTVLNTPITLAQLTGAISTAASQEGLSTLAVALGNLQVQLNAPGTITLGTLLTSDGLVGTTRINALSLVTGAVQLFNKQNVATTTAPITVSGLDLGLLGTVANVQVLAQVVEAPVYACGPAGTTFHTAAIRLKLSMTLVQLFPSTSGINILGLTISDLTVGQLTLYVELARADGILTAVNAVSNTLSAQVTPGVAALYIGSMPDAVFFNRSHAINPATDLAGGTIGSVNLNGTVVGLFAKAAAVGSGLPSTLNFSGAGVQTRTASSGLFFTSTLLSSLFTNLSVSVSPDLLGGVLDGLLFPVLALVVDTTLAPVLATLTSGLVDPLLAIVGIRIGEVDVSTGGSYLECALAGCVYADPNHNARQDSGETGTGTTLYAKAILPALPTTAVAVVAVDPATGNFSFPTLNPSVYTIVIGTSSSPTVVAPAAPAGWLGTEAPTLSRSVSLVAADVVNQRFGLYHGSTVAGTVFKDNGVGGGNANNGLKDGGETAIGGTLVAITDTTGATTWDTARSDPTGAYLLWVPFTAGATPLKVAQAADATSVFVSGKPGTTGGAFALANATTSFTNVVGTAFTGVDFGDVPINRLDTDGQQSVAAGTTAIYAHVFHPGSAGQLSLSIAAATSAPTGWSATLWQDTNCNGQLDSGEGAIAAPVAVTADTALCVVVKVFVPETAPNEARTTYVLTAAMAYANSTLVLQQQRADLTIVGTADGLRLVKSVDKAVAASGTTITYTLTYLNQGAAGVTTVKIRDATPAWTVLDAASCGPKPAGITACAVTAQPAVGAAGSVEWTLTGTLASGATGTVVFSVKVL